MKCVVKMYRKHVQAGRVFLHEQPAHATPWVLSEVEKMMREEGVELDDADQCMSCLRTRGHNSSVSVLAKANTFYDQDTRIKLRNV